MTLREGGRFPKREGPALVPVFNLPGRGLHDLFCYKSWRNVERGNPPGGGSLKGGWEREASMIRKAAVESRRGEILRALYIRKKKYKNEKEENVSS